jgi:hypothetical protein
MGYVIWPLYQATFFDDQVGENVWSKVLPSIEHADNRASQAAWYPTLLAAWLRGS